MFKLRINVGHYYALTLGDEHTIAFAVLYGFERGKNKDVYTLRMYTRKGDFEFPIEESTFNKWIEEGRIKEITPDDALVYAIGND
jgi:hypothetical protein